MRAIVIEQYGGPEQLAIRHLPDARNRGIGRSFFLNLEEKRPFEAVALALEVSPGNHRARRLCESLGFRPRRNSTPTRRLGERGQS